MREVIKGYRLKVKLIEDEAGEAVERLFTRPTLNDQVLAALSGAVVAKIRPQVNQALKEGSEYGTYTRSKIGK
jgi:hypothetical protein